MTIVKALLEALAVLVSELLVTAVFIIGVVLTWSGPAKAVGLELAVWVTVTSPFFWPLVVAVVTLVV